VIEELNLLRVKCYEKILILFIDAEVEWWMRNYQNVFASAHWKINIGFREDRTLRRSATEAFLLPEDLKDYLDTISTTKGTREMSVRGRQMGHSQSYWLIGY
jgi:hypothetical protein